MKPRDLYLDQTGPYILFPVAHHSYEFTLAAIAAFGATNPAAVAVEYPFLFQEMILRAVSRLPKISCFLDLAPVRGRAGRGLGLRLPRSNPI